MTIKKRDSETNNFAMYHSFMRKHFQSFWKRAPLNNICVIAIGLNDGEQVVIIVNDNRAVCACVRACHNGHRLYNDDKMRNGIAMEGRRDGNIKTDVMVNYMPLCSRFRYEITFQQMNLYVSMVSHADIYIAILTTRKPEEFDLRKISHKHYINI